MTTVFHVGFTGTQTRHKRAAPESDEDVLASTLGVLRRRHGDVILHHGDCIGMDALAHGVCRSLGIGVILHPPKDDSKRAFSVGAIDTREPGDYLSRNRDIVNECRELIAMPRKIWLDTLSESGVPIGKRAGGTYATVRYARIEGKPVIVL